MARRFVPASGTIFGLIAMVATARAAVPRPADLEARLAALVERTREEDGIPALAAAVVADGELVAEVVSGSADREANRKASLETVFPAASVSKLLTTALVMQQVEEGRLELDAPVNDALVPALRIRDAQGREAPVTLRQLLSHTSGLPVSWGGIHLDPDDPPVRLEEHLAQRLRVIHPPGERIVYANDAFALAGLLAARAAGTDFESLAQERLLRPLGMSSSSFNPAPFLRERLAAAYGTMRGGSERTDHADVQAVAPAGSLVTTASDLAQFARLILAEGEIEGLRLLQAGSVREMLRLQARAHPALEEGFGLGFAVREGPGRRMVWWDGGLPGAAARLALLPDDGIGVAILSNLARNGPVNVLSRRLFEELLGAERTSAVRPDPASQHEIVGSYRPIDMLDPEIPLLDLVFNVDVIDSEGTLEMRLSLLRETATLAPLGLRRFRIEGGFFDGATALVDGDRLYVHALVARRLAWWETATAVLAYAGLLAVGLVSIPAVVVWRLVRRRRARARARRQRGRRG